jgi:hypothetical protein
VVEESAGSGSGRASVVRYDGAGSAGAGVGVVGAGVASADRFGSLCKNQMAPTQIASTTAARIARKRLFIFLRLDFDNLPAFPI